MDNAESQPENTDAPTRQEMMFALLASDLALEVKAEFEGRRSVGFDMPAATGHVLGKFRSALASPQEGPVVLIALAVLQVQEGELQSVIRDAAVDLIDSGEALNAYRADDAAQRKGTKAILDQFADLLQNEKVRDE